MIISIKNLFIHVVLSKNGYILMKPCLNLNMSIQIISPSIVIASLVAVLMLYAYQYTLT